METNQFSHLSIDEKRKILIQSSSHNSKSFHNKVVKNAKSHARKQAAKVKFPENYVMPKGSVFGVQDQGNCGKFEYLVII
jgi:hypothetical protein